MSLRLAYKSFGEYAKDGEINPKQNKAKQQLEHSNDQKT